MSFISGLGVSWPARIQEEVNDNESHCMRERTIYDSRHTQSSRFYEAAVKCTVGLTAFSRSLSFKVPSLASDERQVNAQSFGIHRWDKFRLALTRPTTERHVSVKPTAYVTLAYDITEDKHRKSKNKELKELCLRSKEVLLSPNT